MPSTAPHPSRCASCRWLWSSSSRGETPTGMLGRSTKIHSQRRCSVKERMCEVGWVGWVVIYLNWRWWYWWFSSIFDSKANLPHSEVLLPKVNLFGVLNCIGLWLSTIGKFIFPPRQSMELFHWASLGIPNCDVFDGSCGVSSCATDLGTCRGVMWYGWGCKSPYFQVQNVFGMAQWYAISLIGRRRSMMLS